MYRVIDKRDTGKTRKLLEECAYSGGVFVCKHPDNVRSKCIAYGIDFSRIQYVYSYEDFINNYRGNNPVYIDELEVFMNNLYKGIINGYTLTNED